MSQGPPSVFPKPTVLIKTAVLAEMLDSCMFWVKGRTEGGSVPAVHQYITFVKVMYSSIAFVLVLSKKSFVKAPGQNCLFYKETYINPRKLTF